MIANDSVEWGCIPKTVGLAVIIVVAPILSLVGLKVVNYYQAKYKWRPKSIVVGSLISLAFIPVSGAVASATWGTV